MKLLNVNNLFQIVKIGLLLLGWVAIPQFAFSQSERLTNKSKSHFKSHQYFLYSGTWEYVKIVKNGKTIEPFTPSDTMEIHVNSFEGTSVSNFRADSLKNPSIFNNVFYYNIPTIKKNAGGNFAFVKVPKDSSLHETALLFHYLTNQNASINVKRLFNIDSFTGNTFVIREGNTYFHYRRKTNPPKSK